VRRPLFPIETERLQLRPGDAVDVAVIVRESGALAGSVSLSWNDGDHRQGELGFIFDLAHHGNGDATEAARALLRVENELVKGEWTDELVYALLEREWRAD
jgi:RimJ/RimL family protein N-acetyltransferase